ncbi:MAG: zf-HC2 domain-containing protein [bacterium]|nr:zf-HC2 domain-containing protein [bacterium]
MNCKNAKESICSYLDDLLTQQEQAELNLHLEDCADCSSYLEDLREGLDMLHELPLESPSENFEWNLKRKINEAVTEQAVLAKHQKKSSFWPQFATSAAAALLIALCGAWFWYSGLMSSIPDIESPIFESSTEIVEDASPMQPSPAGRGGERLGPAIPNFTIVGDQQDGGASFQGHSTILPSRPEDMGPFLPDNVQLDDSESAADSLMSSTDENRQ